MQYGEVSLKLSPQLLPVSQIVSSTLPDKLHQSMRHGVIRDCGLFFEIAMSSSCISLMGVPLHKSTFQMVCMVLSEV